MVSTLEQTTALEEKPLIEASLDGNQDAWAELVARYGRLVMSVTRHCGLRENDAHDVFQNVFMFLFNQLPKLRDRSSLAKWLITTTQRTALRHRQRCRNAIPLDGASNAQDETPAPPAVVLRWEQQHQVRQALRRLGGRGEQLLSALYLGQPRLTYDEISRRLGIPRGSIGPTRIRCLAKLLAILRDSHEREGVCRRDGSTGRPFVAPG